MNKKKTAVKVKDDELSDIDQELNEILNEGAVDTKKLSKEEHKEEVSDDLENILTEDDAEDKDDAESEGVLSIDISEIDVPKKLLRNVPSEEIDDLASSIKNDGLLQPIVVSSDKMLIAGYRRLLACKKLKMKTVSVNMIDCSTDDQYRVAVVENVQRKQLSIDEEANSYKTLLEDVKRFPTQKALAKAIGVSEAKISLTLKSIGETKEYSKATQKREHKKSTKVEKIKVRKFDDKNIPDGIVVTASKHAVNMLITLKLKNDSHAKLFDVKKELLAIAKEFNSKEFNSELNIIRAEL